MYQLNETDVRREHHHESLEGSGDLQRASARRNGTDLSYTRLQVVRVPGGFAFVEDKPATDSD
jgi:hypothetical protein